MFLNVDPTSFQNLNYGLYIVASVCEDKKNAQIVNTVFRVSSRPFRIAVGIHKESLTHQYIQSSKKFSIAILDEETPIEFIRLFGFSSGRNVDKFAGVKHKSGKAGTPIILENVILVMEAVVVEQVDAGTHSFFVGDIVNAEVLKDGKPLTYSYYRDVRKGALPAKGSMFAADSDDRKGEIL